MKWAAGANTARIGTDDVKVLVDGLAEYGNARSLVFAELSYVKKPRY
jgi:hypothetical protein